MRRICLVGAAMAASLLGFGAASSTAASKSKVKPVKVTCRFQVTDAVPVGADSVTAGASQGTQFGTASCGKPLGGGVFADGFTVQDTGDTTGAFKQYAGLGSIHGTYDLAQSSSSGPPTAYDFGNADLVGTIKIKGGTGAYAKAKGTGTEICSTTDSIHYSCVEKLKLTAL